MLFRSTVKRVYRGAEYRITVENPNGVQKGVKHVTVDGQAIEGNVLPVAKAGSVCEVRVVMG